MVTAQIRFGVPVPPLVYSSWHRAPGIFQNIHVKLRRVAVIFERLQCDHFLTLFGQVLELLARSPTSAGHPGPLLGLAPQTARRIKCKTEPEKRNVPL